MQTASPSRVVYLSVPESLRGKFEGLKDFALDPAIPIPVALEPGAQNLDIEGLSWEMILSGMIRVLMDNPDDEDAPYYRRFVLTVKPNLLAEFTQAAVVKTKNGDYTLALEIASALEGLFPQEPSPGFTRAFILEERAHALDQAGQENPADAEYDAALRAYQRALAFEAPFPPGLFNAGYFFMKRRNYPQAKACFQRFLALTEDESPEKEAALGILQEIEAQGLEDPAFQEAYLQIRHGDPAQGLAAIKDFLQRRPQGWNGWFLLGWGLRKLGRWKDGAAAFRKCIDLGGGNSDTRNELAICLIESGDLPGAKKELEECLKEEPENVKVLSNLGVLALKKGSPQEAEGFFRAALDLEPQDPVAGAYFS
jgi:tetratricopeptide (TPR) repeat protein